MVRGAEEIRAHASMARKTSEGNKRQAGFTRAIPKGAAIVAAI